jgi:uncharacterized repeat protein (TIGR01451 family)
MRSPIGALAITALVLAPAAGAVTRDGEITLTGPDVSVSVVAPKVVKHGKLLTYMVTVRNAGPEAATDVVITNQLWKRAPLVAISRSQGSYGFVLAQRGGTLTWELDQLESGTSAVLFLTVRPASRGALADTVAATAPGDPDATSNDARVTTRVT